MDFRGFEMGVDGRIDLDEVAIAPQPLQKGA
jgi:hypothetical protein